MACMSTWLCIHYKATYSGYIYKLFFKSPYTPAFEIINFLPIWI
ncbi:MAG: hypothetical protein UZ08_BCD001001898 [Candidatus Parvibacillus calidus]|jgi:hypothetical protein|nr:MAG: hypothetical protein UZ08_BCD001001898 [Candidatus Parvibacillus calidus]